MGLWGAQSGARQADWRGNRAFIRRLTEPFTQNQGISAPQPLGVPDSSSSTRMPSRTFWVPSITTRSPFFKLFAATHWMLALSLAMAARDLFLPVGVVGLIALELCLVAGTGRA